MSERLTPERLAELRRIAEAATQGPWDRSEGDTDIYIVGGCDRDVAHIDLLGLANARAQDRDNARHIAAFDPPTVLALLDEIERLREGRSLAQAAVEDAIYWLWDDDENEPWLSEDDQIRAVGLLREALSFLQGKSEVPDDV